MEKIATPLPGETMLSSFNGLEKAQLTSSQTVPDEMDVEVPDDADLKSLRKIADKVSLAIYLVGAAEIAERFAYRCLTGPLQNYVQNSYNDPLRPGALGLGQETATALGFFFQFWCYLTPIMGAVVADSWLGRFKTILGGALISTCGFTILFATSLPASLRAKAGLPGLIVSLLIIGLGTGGIKSNVGPLIADQYTGKSRRIKTLKSGERVILDPDLTIQLIFSRYYWLINIGSASMLVATWVELKVGFWATFLLALCFYAAALVVLLFSQKLYIQVPPQGSIIPKSFRALWIGFKHRDMNKAKPSYLTESGHGPVPWTDHFIEEIKIVLVACRVFAFFPLFWLCMGQTGGNVISLAAKTNTYGLPNDFFGGFNPVTILIMIPILDHLVYPTLRKCRIPFRPVTRITIGFVMLAGALAFAAGIQSMVRKHPDEQVSYIWILPIFILAGISEILSFLSAVELAYTKAPKTMKSLISSINLLACSLGAAFGFALSPTSTYSKVEVEFAVLAGLMGALAVVFYVIFAKYNKTEEEMNRVERESVDGDS